MTEETFRNMARKIGIEDGFMSLWVDQARTAILDTWRKSKGDFGYDTQAQDTIERHLARVPLLSR